MPTSRSRALRPLVRITITDDVVLRFTEKPALSDVDAHIWQPRILDMGDLHYELGHGARQPESSLSITLDDNDGQVTTWLRQYEWGNRNVEVLVGEGNNPANYTTVFTGIVRFPDAWEREKRREGERESNRVRVWCTDRRVADDTEIPPCRINPDHQLFQSCEDRAQNVPVPLVYGAFTGQPTGNPIAPAYCYETGGVKFIVCGHAGTFGTIYKITKNAYGDDEYTDITGRVQSTNGSDTSLADAGIDYACTFVLDTYDPKAEQIAAQITGPASLGSDCDNAADIIEDLLTTWGGVDSEDIDSTSFATVHSAVNSYLCRRWIGGRVGSIWPYIQELCDEIGLDLLLKGQKYYLYERKAAATAAATYRGYHLAQGSFRETRDPQAQYCNRLSSDYNRGPTQAHPWHAVLYDPAEQTLQDDGTGLGTVEEQEFPFLWMPYTEDVIRRMGKLLPQLADSPKVVEMTLPVHDIERSVGDTIALDFDPYNGRKAQIRSISKNPLHATTGLHALIYPVAFWPPITNDGRLSDLHAWTQASGSFVAYWDGTIEAFCVKCLTAGNIGIAVPSEMQDLTQGETVWTWKMLKKGASDSIFFYFCSDSIGSPTAGYSLVFGVTEQVILDKIGVGSLMSSAVGYINNEQHYDCRVVRTQGGKFSVYVDGTLVPAEGGSNPVTDTTTTTAPYWSAHLSAGSLISLAEQRLRL